VIRFYYMDKLDCYQQPFYLGIFQKVEGRVHLGTGHCGMVVQHRLLYIINTELGIEGMFKIISTIGISGWAIISGSLLPSSTRPRSLVDVHKSPGCRLPHSHT
jgi:hypothetical protein